MSRENLANAFSFELFSYITYYSSTSRLMKYNIFLKRNFYGISLAESLPVYDASKGEAPPSLRD